jgi:hypothetical protein
VTPTVGALCPFGKARFTSPADNASASGKFPDVRLWQCAPKARSLVEEESNNPPRATAAEQAFVESINIARGQQARTFELRATLSLAKQYCATGRHRAVRELLVLALVGFSEGPEFPEVGESLRLLASLDQISGTVV